MAAADTRRVLTADEAAQLRDAATADELEQVAREVRARWVAEALEATAVAVAEQCGHKDYRERGQGDTFEERRAGPKIWPAEHCPFCSKETALVRALATEYRDGRR